MKTTTIKKIRALRQVLDQTQTEFAATIGASKDAVASWETGRNELSASLARRIALATGVDERWLLRANLPMLTLDLPRRPFTRAEFEAHQQTFWGGNAETNARQHARRCADTLELLFLAAARSGEGSQLGGVLGSFIEWSREAREQFGLGKAIDAQLAQRTRTFALTKSYAQWREMAKLDPDAARLMGFKDDPRKGNEESLTLSVETVPVWTPGQEMRGGRGKS